MDHNDIRHKLSEYIDGTLTPQEKASVEEHLKTCPNCSNALSELQKTVEHIRKVEEVEPPAWMTQKIMAKVRAEEEKKKQGLLHRLFFPLHIKLPLETIGVLFIAVTVYFVVQETETAFSGSTYTDLFSGVSPASRVQEKRTRLPRKLHCSVKKKYPRNRSTRPLT